MSNGHIFISYRRDDTAGFTRAIYDQLAERFTNERIFMDVDAIEPGLPFDEVITQAVSRCEILLAMIGKHWMDQQPGAVPRINDEKDFVRLEIAAALSRNIRVIPVLLDGVSMPSEELLPEPLRALARLNAIEIGGGARFRSDVERLIKVVSKVLGESNAPPSQKRFRSHRTMQYWLFGGLTAFTLFSSIAYFYTRKDDSQTAHRGPDSTTSTGVKVIPPTIPPPAEVTGPDLCKDLDGKSIDFNGNNYLGVVGPTGIKLIEKLGAYRFETEILFSNEDIIKQFGKILRDQIVGVCHDNLITLDRVLLNGKIHPHTGKLYRAETGRIAMEGTFIEGEPPVEYKWYGKVDTPNRQ